MIEAMIVESVIIMEDESVVVMKRIEQDEKIELRKVETQ